MGLALAIGRAGSFSADMSPTWFADARWMMLFFGIMSALGFAFAVLLWVVAGRSRDEATACAA
jgi:hypothetical protein